MQIDAFQQGSARKTNTQEQSEGVENTVNAIRHFRMQLSPLPPPPPPPDPPPPWSSRPSMAARSAHTKNKKIRIPISNEKKRRHPAKHFSRPACACDAGPQHQQTMMRPPQEEGLAGLGGSQPSKSKKERLETQTFRNVVRCLLLKDVVSSKPRECYSKLFVSGFADSTESGKVCFCSEGAVVFGETAVG